MTLNKVNRLSTTLSNSKISFISHVQMGLMLVIMTARCPLSSYQNYFVAMCTLQHLTLDSLLPIAGTKEPKRA